MTPRERVLAVLNNKPVDRTPVDLWYTGEVADALKAHFNVTDDFDWYRALNLDKIVWLFPGYKNPASEKATGSQVGAQTVAERTMWGVPLKAVQSGEAVYHEFGAPPLKDCESSDSLDRYAFWPNPDYFDYQGSLELAEKASGRYATLGPWVSFYEVYCQMRGLEQSLMDLMTNAPLASAILDRIEDCQTRMLKRFMQTLDGHLDMVFISDDMGMQQGLLIPPAIWETFFKTRMKRWCDLIHSFGKKVFYHSDGAVEPLIAPLLDCGIDVLNPIQHVCPGMDTAGLKKKYGSRVVFHGGIDNQSVLPFGSPQDVRRETKMCLDTLGAGYIVCSCHNVQAGTPVENIIAMVETVTKG